MKQRSVFHSENNVLNNKPMVLGDWAYEQIKRWIFDRVYPPGASLIINDLASKMNISSTPVRDALRRLEAEGFIQVRPRSGFFVPEINQVDLRHLFELRILIEGFAAEKAAHLLKPEDIDTLDELFGECLPAEDAEYSNEFLDADQRFHSIIIEGTQNPKISQTMDSLRDLTHQGHLLGLTSFENVQHSCEEHKQVLLALRERDGEEAGRCMRFHLASVMERLLGLLNAQDLSQADPSNMMDVRDANRQPND